jgi:hypothetical protein
MGNCLNSEFNRQEWVCHLATGASVSLGRVKLLVRSLRVYKLVKRQYPKILDYLNRISSPEYGCI